MRKLEILLQIDQQTWAYFGSIFSQYCARVGLLNCRIITTCTHSANFAWSLFFFKFYVQGKRDINIHSIDFFKEQHFEKENNSEILYIHLTKSRSCSLNLGLYPDLSVYQYKVSSRLLMYQYCTDRYIDASH